MEQKTRKRLTSAAWQALALICGLVIVFPVLYGVLGAFKTSSEFAQLPPTLLPKSFANLENFRTVFARIPVMRQMMNSFIVAMLVSVVRLTVAVLAAYAFVFFDFRGKRILFFFVLGTMMLPADTLLIGNYQTVAGMGLTDTYLGMSIVSFIGASQMFMLRQSFKSSPTALREAAQIDGCGDMRFIASILVPVSKPILVTLFLQSFVASWNTYLWPLLVTNRSEMRTIQVGITMLTTIEGTNYETILAGTTIALIPAMVLFILLRRNITRSMTAGAVVG